MSTGSSDFVPDPMTPAGPTASYCTPAQFLLLRDPRPTGMLVRDGGSIATPGDLIADPVLAFELERATGVVAMSAARGQRYTAADLDALVAAGGPAAIALASIVADLAAGYLAERRWCADDEDVKAGFDRAVKTLVDLETGEIIFPFLQTEQAGLASTSRITAADIWRSEPYTALHRRQFGVRTLDYRIRECGGGWGWGGGGTR